MDQNQRINQLEAELVKYRLMFHHAPLGIFHVNRLGIITDCNEKLAAILGSSKETLTGINVLELKDETYMASVKKAMQGHAAVYEGDYESVTGHKITPIRVMFAPAGSNIGGRHEVVAIMEDITERKLTEEKLKESEVRRQIALENSGDGVWEWDIETGETEVTERWLEVLGYSDEEMDFGITQFFTYLHPDDMERTTHRLMSLAEGEVDQYHDLFRARAKDGTYKWFASIGKTVEWSKNGRPLRAIGTHRDVTKQQEAIEALKESERSKSVLLSNLPGMAYRCEYTDDRWEMTYVSDGCFDLTGYYPDHLRGNNQSLKNLILPEDIILPEYREELWEKWLQMMQEQKMFRSEYQIRTASGTTKWVWEQGRILTDDLGRVKALECFITDITEQKEAQLKNQQLDLLKDEFLANTSHELRTPLNGIISLVESLLKGIGGPLSEDQRKNLNLVRISAKRLAALVNDILDFSLIKHHEIKLLLKPTDLYSNLNMILDLFRHQAQPENISLVNDVPENCQPLLADENRLNQILFNLIGNALRYTESGEIRIFSEEKEDMLEVSVHDTGIGIPEDRLSTVFEYFEQTGLSPERENTGTGLGLPITRRLVELHGGTIKVCSTVGKGSTFTFSLPLAKTGEPVAMSLVEEDEPLLHLTTGFYINPVTELNLPSVQKSEFTVMVVDDEPVNIQALVNVLSFKGIRVIPAVSGKQALDLLSKSPVPDLCIIDIMMPKMNGFDLCKQIRSRFTGFELPVIFLTARYGESDLALGFAAGGNDFLHKPFEESELIARVETLLNLKKSVSKALAVEIAFLQAQIKPHFLYNALNTIAAYCETESEKAGRLILSLSQYLRGSLAFENLQDSIPLERELQLTEAYAEIEKARFPKVSVDYQIEPGIQVTMPPLVIQPIVENAIRHGICPKKEGGTVTVSVHRINGGVSVTVQDNGVGTDPELIRQAMNRQMCGKSVGLCNIHTRLNRLFGSGLSITSLPGAGTTVQFMIPE